MRKDRSMGGNTSINLSVQEKAKKWDELHAKRLARSAKSKQARRKRKVTYGWLTPCVLAAELQRILVDYSWTTEYTLNGQESKERVDVFGRHKNNGDHLVYVEVEGGRGAPVCNTAKVWRCVEGGKDKTPAILVQLFSSNYEEGTRRTMMKEAIFIGEQAERATKIITYRYLGPDDWPSGPDQLCGFVDRVSKLFQPRPAPLPGPSSKGQPPDPVISPQYPDP
ncbi:MAG: hypothetical protein NTU41_10690 [Chloroflexi bacterium]|nr:hypothetical protein [Chloroflexota bacterium]